MTILDVVLVAIACVLIDIFIDHCRANKREHDLNVDIICKEGVEIPSKRVGDAGYDLRAQVTTTIPPGEVVLVPLGIRTAYGSNLFAFLLPRSGLACKFAITLINSPGLIDSGYRNEWKAAVVNHLDEPFEIKAGDRICQALFIEHADITFTGVKEFGNISDRGGGFGSTGVK